MNNANTNSTNMDVMRDIGRVIRDSVYSEPIVCKVGSRSGGEFLSSVAETHFRSMYSMMASSNWDKIEPPDANWTKIVRYFTRGIVIENKNDSSVRVYRRIVRDQIVLKVSAPQGGHGHVKISRYDDENVDIYGEYSSKYDGISISLRKEFIRNSALKGVTWKFLYTKSWNGATESEARSSLPVYEIHVHLIKDYTQDGYVSFTDGDALNSLCMGFVAKIKDVCGGQDATLMLEPPSS